jgi:uncharacterized protein YegL
MPATDLIIRVPEHTPFQIARVRLTLQLSGDPSGTKISRGDTTIELAAGSGSGSGNGSASGQIEEDIVQLSNVGDNRIEIEVRFVSDFNSIPTNYTDHKNEDPRFDNSTYDWPITVQTPGSVSITGYILTSYIAPSKEAANTTSRRLGSPVAKLLNNDGTDVTFSQIASRHPYDIIMVLDKSGSMNTTVKDEPSVKRIDLLNTSASAFIDDFEMAGAPPPGISSEPKDRIAILSYNQNVTPEARGTWHERNSWSGIAPMLTAGGSTAMGDGLTEAFKFWENSDSQNDLAIILMTDGKQNTGCLVEDNSEDLKTFCDATQDNNRVAIAAMNALVQTVVIGAPGSPHTELLNEIARETGAAAFAIFGSDPDDMSVDENFDGTTSMPDSFVNGMLDILKGNTLSNLYQRPGAITSAQPEQATTHAIDSTIRRVIAVLNWRGRSHAVYLDMENQNGDPIKPTEEREHEFYRIYAFDVGEGAVATPGNWRAVVKNRRDTMPDAGQDYSLTIQAVEGVLDYQIWFDKATTTTGAPIGINLSVGLNGKPTSNVEAEVLVARPGEGYGTFMHENDTLPPDPGEDDVRGNDPQPLFADKEQLLMEKGNLLETVKPQLAGRGRSMDAQGDGFFRLVYTETEKPGLYRFLIRLTVNYENASLRRVEEHQIMVHILEIDYANSTFQLNNGILVFTPRDRFGNYLGPGYENRLRIMAGEQSLDKNDNRARGIYTIDTRNFASTELVISFGPRVIVRGTPDAIASGKGTTPDGDGNGKDEPTPEGCLSVITRLIRQLTSRS